MSESKQSLSAFAEKSQKSLSEFNQILGRTILVSPNEEQYELLLKRLKQQLGEGRGEVILEIGGSEDGTDGGLGDDEMDAAVATLQSLASSLDCSCVKLRDRKDQRGTVAQFLIRRLLDQSDFLEIRVAVVGNVDAGKSTLLGVLTHGELDNGRGHARQKLFRHKHEMESGRTSSVGNDILGFDGEGNVVNKPEHGSLDWVKICEKSSKVITFIDLAGHERYLKTTVFGMTGHAPDFGMLMIGANAGIIGMTKEHLGLALALSVPVFVVVTKIDMCPVNVLQENLKMLVRILKSPGCRKVPVMVKSTDDVVLSATNFVSERLCPIFQVSNVSGENLALLKTFLNLLTTRMEYKENEPAEFQIDDSYSVPGVGTVVSGTTLKGVIKLNDTLMLGPDPLGHFQLIPVKSIHRKRMAVREVRAGQTASFALKKIKRSQIRKGMVMVCPSLNPQACWEFEGEILVLHHPTTISSRYQAMVHCGSIRQTASIISMSQECLRTGDKALIHFRFIKYPEYIVPGQRMVFREGRTKAVGNVVNIFTHTPVSQIGTKSKINKQQQRFNTSQQSSGKITNHTVNNSAVPHNTGQNLQQPKVVAQYKCEYVNCEKSERTHPALKFFPFPKDQRYKKWIVNSGTHFLKNLPPEQLHRKYICSDHFEDSSYSDALKTKLRRDAHPAPYKSNQIEKVLLPRKEQNNNSDKKTNTSVADVKFENNKSNSEAASLKTKQVLSDILKKCRTGYNSQLLTQIKCKVDAMSNKEKYCTLMFDEITIDGQLVYSPLLDQIEGFEDFGPFGKLNEVGKEVMLFMAQGIYSDWKMPIAYFVSSSGIKTHLLSKIILETVKKLLQTGLKLVSIVSDQGHNNVPSTRRLGVTTEAPYFQVGSKRIYAIFDVPNLFKSIKNNFTGADLLYKDKLVSFKDVIETCSIDKQNGNKLKLTDSHLNPNYVEKFEIPLALQTFSNTVATCIKSFVSENKLKSNTAGNTAEFIKDLNDLFDCLNSKGYEDQNEYKRSISKNNPQIINKLKDAKEWMGSLYKVTETGAKAPRSFSGLIQTITAIQMIYEEQSSLGLDYLPTCKFNIDVLQEFSNSFNKSRTIKTVRIFREKFLCECTNNLLRLSDLSNNSSNIDFGNDEYTPSEVLPQVEMSLPAEQDIVAYFAAYLVKICLEKFNCDRCKKMLQRKEALNNNILLSVLCQSYNLNENSVKDLREPTEDFLKYTERSEKIFRKVCHDKMRKSGVSEHITREIVSVLSSTLDMAQCQGHLEYITREFVVRRLYIECCMLNRNLKD